MSQRFTTGLAIIAAFCAPSVVADSAPGLRGDAAAVARVEKLLDVMGGAELWARSAHLYIEQRGWFTGPAEAALEYSWRSLVSPVRRTHIIGRHTDTQHVVTEGGGFTNRKGVMTELSAEDHARRVSSWQNGSYTMLARLAKGDPGIRLAFVEPNRIRILDDDDVEISWYEINEYGHWMKWGRTGANGRALEYVYGPPRDFGNLRFPAWGAATDGSWRYNYEVVQLIGVPIPEELLEPPQ